MQATIVGGGIGGLTSALALRQAGIDVEVLERASALTEVGAGVQLGPNATRVLCSLGLDAEMRAIGIAPAGIEFRRWRDDQLLARQDLSDVDDRYGAPYLTAYRPDVIAMLAGRLPASVVRLASDVTHAEAAPGGSRVVVGQGERVDADLVVGADGIHSAVRTSVLGEDSARFSGMCAYRALVPCERAEAAQYDVKLWFGPERHLVVYPVGARTTYLNVVAVAPEPEWAEESWTAPGSVDALREHFAGWGPLVQDVLGRVADPIWRWAVCDREPLERWTVGSTTLLGDACHPMLPFLAQGAGQAIGDAAALSAALSQAASVPEALRRYEAARRPHTSRVQRLSWANNEVYHLPDGAAQEERDRHLQRSGGTLETLRWLYGNDPARLDITESEEEQ